MDLCNKQESVADLLFVIRSKGIRIWSEDGQLRYQARKGTLANEDIQLLKTYKSEIVAFLSGKLESENESIRLSPRMSSGPVPVTPIQYWRLRNFHPKYHTRPVSPVHLFGRLDVEALRKAFQEISLRHESLRTRFIFTDSEILQDVRAEPPPFSVVDLTQIDQALRMAEARRILGQHNFEKIDPTSDPLFMGTLVKLGETEFLLLIHCHDCIGDGTSSGILVKDFWTIYVDTVKKIKSRLPPVEIQLADFAAWLNKSESYWHKQHAGYWRNHLAGAARVRLFPQKSSLPGVVKQIAIFHSKIGSDITAALRALSRENQTSLGMVIMTAWVAMMLKWCNTREIVLAFLTSGRVHSTMANSFGCFMSPLYLRIETAEDDRLVDLMKRVSKEYGAAYEHHDFGRLLARESDMECIANPLLNWLPLGILVDPAAELTRAAGEACVETLRIVPFEYKLPHRSDVESDFEPAFAFIETEDEIVVRIFYRTDLISVAQIQKLAENVNCFVSLFHKEPAARLASLSCV